MRAFPSSNRSRGGSHKKSNRNSSYNSNYNNSNYNNSNYNTEDSFASPIAVEILGWEGSSDVRDVQAFVSRKKRISITNLKPRGNILYAMVMPNDLDALLELNGIRFAGKNLSISQSLNSHPNQLNNQSSSFSHTKNFNTINSSSPFNSRSLNNNNNNNSNSHDGTSSTILMLTTFLQKRYNQDEKFLDLQNLAGDPYLQENGLFSSNSTKSKMFPALMKVAERDLSARGKVESISLDSNSLPDVSSVTTLAVTFPYIKNLSLANNQIATFKALEPWRSKFPSLQQLILLNNPITNDIAYKETMLKFFPKLMVLDTIQVRTQEDLLASMIHYPVKSLRQFFENNDITMLASSFLLQFFEFYDSNRMNLLTLYDMSSQFSLSLDTFSTPPSTLPAANTIITSKSTSSSTNNQPSINPPKPKTALAGGHWSSYKPLSRNLLKVTGPSSRVSKCAVGPQQIAALFAKLPKTEHDVKALVDSFAIEAWNVSNIREVNDTCVAIVVHGDFTEINEASTSSNTLLNGSLSSGNLRNSSNNSNSFRRGNRRTNSYNKNNTLTNDSYDDNSNINNKSNNEEERIKRAFDRFFILSPTNTPAGMLIVSDLLTIRPYTVENSWQTLEEEQQAEQMQNTPQIIDQTQITQQINNQGSEIILQDLDGLDERQILVVRQIMELSRLTPKFARMCAEQGGFDVETSMRLFTDVNSKGDLAPEAFQ